MQDGPPVALAGLWALAALPDGPERRVGLARARRAWKLAETRPARSAGLAATLPLLAALGAARDVASQSPNKVREY